MIGFLGKEVINLQIYLFDQFLKLCNGIENYVVEINRVYYLQILSFKER